MRVSRHHRVEDERSPEMLIYVTGATGLLGNNLIRTLLAQGHQVRGLVRDLDKAQELFPTSSSVLRWVRGDMLEVDAVASSLEGVDCVVHTAAYFRDSYKGGEHYQRMLQVNVDGTAALLKAAYERGVRRFVHVSSIATVKSEPGQPAEEDMRRAFEGEPDDYFRSKILSDQVVEDFAKAHPDFEVSFVLPGFMVGPGDLGPTSAGQLVLDFARKKLPGVMNAGFSFVDARDVAQACAALSTSSRPGERYLVAGRYHSLTSAYAQLAPITSVAAPKRMIPDFFLLAYAFFSEVYARITGKPVLLSWAGVQSMRRERPHGQFDSSKAERELGVTFRPLAETFGDTFKDYVKRDWLAAVASHTREPTQGIDSQPRTNRPQ